MEVVLGAGAGVGWLVGRSVRRSAEEPHCVATASDCRVGGEAPFMRSLAPSASSPAPTPFCKASAR